MFVRILKDAHDEGIIDLRRRGDDFEVARAAEAAPVAEQLAQARAGGDRRSRSRRAVGRPGAAPRHGSAWRGADRAGGGLARAPPPELLSIGVVDEPAPAAVAAPVEEAPATTVVRAAPVAAQAQRAASRAATKTAAQRTASEAGRPRPASGRQESRARRPARRRNGAPTKSSDDERRAESAAFSSWRRPLPASFYDRPTELVARDLLGAVLECRTRDGVAAGRIVETEAYLGEHDLACHAAAGRTARTAPLYGPPGIAYVYFIYGMHWCVNAVTRAKGEPSAVLDSRDRAGAGHRVDARASRRRATRRRSHERPRESCVDALGIDGRFNRAVLAARPPLAIRAGAPIPDSRVAITPRIGITRCADWPLRWIVADSAFVSAKPPPRTFSPRLTAARSVARGGLGVCGRVGLELGVGLSSADQCTIADTARQSCLGSAADSPTRSLTRIGERQTAYARAALTARAQTIAHKARPTIEPHVESRTSHGGSAETARGLEREPRQCCRAVSAALHWSRGRPRAARRV